MSITDYFESQKIAAEGHSFYGLLFATIRQADTDNLKRLEAGFPDEVKELKARYNAPGGALNELEMDIVKRHYSISEDDEETEPEQ